ncbi:MAG TPA: YraN family protein [Gammaproteobacteria bacterium]|nr:YraN family protein [Gammaproteobacteria bacterium]
MEQDARGREAEDRALEFLRQQGMKLVARNFNSRYGEIDLIMQHREQGVIFVEVRYRHSHRWGSGAESVNGKKQAKLIRTALYFLQQNPRWQSMPARFDVIALGGGTQQIDWISDAFSVSAW